MLLTHYKSLRVEGVDYSGFRTGADLCGTRAQRYRGIDPSVCDLMEVRLNKASGACVPRNVTLHVPDLLYYHQLKLLKA